MIAGSISTASTCLRAVPERGRDVGARAGAENQDVVERVAEDGVRPLVEVFLLLDRRHRLVEDVVHLDDRVGALLADGDLVVRRPDRAARHDLNEAQRDREQRQADGHAGERLSLAGATLAARRRSRAHSRRATGRPTTNAIPNHHAGDSCEPGDDARTPPRRRGCRRC